MSNRRYSRKTNGFSKKLKNHRNSIDLFMIYYNFIRVHNTLGTTPAVKAEIADQPYSFEWLVEQIEYQQEQSQKRREKRRKRQVRLEIS